MGVSGACHGRGIGSIEMDARISMSNMRESFKKLFENSTDLAKPSVQQLQGAVRIRRPTTYKFAPAILPPADPGGNSPLSGTAAATR